MLRRFIEKALVDEEVIRICQLNTKTLRDSSSDEVCVIEISQIDDFMEMNAELDGYLRERQGVKSLLSERFKKTKLKEMGYE